MPLFKSSLTPEKKKNHIRQVFFFKDNIYLTDECTHYQMTFYKQLQLLQN